MPNWVYLLVNALYHLGLALWIGGTVALGVLVAPELFKTLPRPQAGGIFGPILRRFTRLRILAVSLIILGAAIRYLAWETHALTPWLVIRWLAIAFLALTVVYEIVSLEPAIEARRKELAPDQGEGDERRQAFQRLHDRAEMLMRMALIAAVVALILS